MNHMTLPIILIFLMLCLYYIYFFVRPKSKRHTRNIKHADVVIKKITTFSYEGAKLNYLRKIDPFVFEEIILTGFEKNGYEIKRNKKYTDDGGIDGKIYKDGKLFLIQAKRYSSAINPKHVEEFANVIIQNNAHGGFFVHTGRTGNMSKEHTSDSLIIISGDSLLKLICK